MESAARHSARWYENLPRYLAAAARSEMFALLGQRHSPLLPYVPPRTCTTGSTGRPGAWSRCGGSSAGWGPGSHGRSRRGTWPAAAEPRRARRADAVRAGTG
ncbi:hypothetical protein SFUMM280S_05841 [Streptomyces fumanus]